MLIVSCALIYDDAIRECAVSTCVDPPIHLLAKIQATLIFFGGGINCIGSHRACCFCLRRRVGKA